MATIKCKMCNNEFEQSDPRQLYCSVKCRNKVAWQRHKNDEKHVCKCKHCGKEFEQKDSRQIYCSEECRIEYKKAKSKRPKINYKKICPTCGNEFNTYDIRKKYCRDKCREKAKPSHNIKKEPRVLNKICPMCNKEFTTDTKRIYCSTECRYKNSLTYHGEIFKKTCQNCGKEFESKNMRTLYCSDDCQEKYHNEKKQNKTKNLLYKSSNFCSHSCSTKFYNEKRKQESPKLYDKVCAYCGKEFQAKTLNAKFCSGKCKTADYKKRKPDIHVDICEYCGEKVIRKAKKRGKHVFCDGFCHKAYLREHNQEQRECLYCKKLFIPEHGKHLYCSNDCKVKYIYYNQDFEHTCSYCHKVFHSRVKNVKFCSTECMLNGMPSRNTIPYIKICNVLDSMNIEYKKEFPIDLCFCDIFIPSKNLVIEVNGVFWHCDSRKFDTIYYKHQYSRIKGDYEKEKLVYERYHTKILFIWEKDILENLDMCCKLIETYIDNDGILENYDSFNYSLIDGELVLNKEIIKPYRSYTLKELDNILSLND